METNFADSPTRNVFAPAATTLPLPATRNSTSPGGDPSRTSNRKLVEMLGESKIYQDYEKAFSAATGLPVSLSPLDSWQLPHRGKKQENGFCALMGQRSRSCSQCLQMQQRLAKEACSDAATGTCFSGLCDTSVPVRLGDRLIGFLQTGQVFRKKPTMTQFNRTAKQLLAWDVKTNPKELKDAYFATRVLSPRQYDSMVTLLKVFAQHIALVSNQVLVQHETEESPVIARAKQFIQQNQSEQLSLAQVAKAVNTSTFHFCKLFKKATGLNFTDYVSRVRIEKAKNLLLNHNLRISEVAFEVGFQSLSNFNRGFKRIVGQSPSEYRAQLPATN